MRLLPAALLLAFAALAISADDYPPGPDSQRQANVPQGTVTKHSWTASKIFPGTTRDYWVYVPAQYQADKPACVMIFQDGGGFVGEKSSWQAPVVLDNLIHKGHLPVMIGIFVNPGVLPARTPDQQDRYNRAFEYDGLGDRYARFLIDELLPEVGKQYNLSAEPSDRGLAGSSSGGIAAFTAAWNRPDSFRRVLSFIGSYTNLKGGHNYPSLIRKMEPKPLRVYLQDGRNDQNIYAGSWFLANQDLFSSLQYAGYDTTFTIGTEGHNGKHGSAILPEALHWLWRGYPQPINVGESKGERHSIVEILEPGKSWEVVSTGHKFTEGPAVDRQGNVFFTDIPQSRIYRVGADGKATLWKEDTGGANGLMFGPDGRLYACQNGRKRIVAYTMDGQEQVLAEGINSNDLAITKQGDIYFTEPPTKRVWLLNAQGEKRVVHEGLAFPNGARLSPDQSLLMVADFSSRVVWSFQVQADGSLANGQPFYRLETADDLASAAADGMTLDTEGNLYVATSMGIQICDPPGRVIGIISKPQPGPLANAVFGGPDRKMLYVTAGDKVYRRPVRRTGTVSWELVKPPAPRL